MRREKNRKINRRAKTKTGEANEWEGKRKRKKINMRDRQRERQREKKKDRGRVRNGSEVGEQRQAGDVWRMATVGESRSNLGDPPKCSFLAALTINEYNEQVKTNLFRWRAVYVIYVQYVHKCFKKLRVSTLRFEPFLLLEPWGRFGFMLTSRIILSSVV